MTRSFVSAALIATLLALVAVQAAPTEASAPTASSEPATTPDTPAAPITAVTPVTLDESQVVETPRGLVLTLEDATFDSNRAIIRPAARRGLDALAQFLHEHPGRRVQIEAFTDADGSNVYNLELSQDRADAVALAVIDRGVDAARVRAVGWGERYPVADNDTEESRARNRRVEIIVSKEDAAVPVRVVNAP